MSKFTDIKQAIKTLKQIGCTSITIDKPEILRELIFEWDKNLGENKQHYIQNNIGQINIYGVQIIERNPYACSNCGKDMSRLIDWDAIIVGKQYCSVECADAGN